MPRVSREWFPPEFRAVLERAMREGQVSVVFESAEDCTRERLRYYRFLAQTRARAGDALQEAAGGVTLQLRAVGMEQVKRQLVLKAAQAGSGAAWSSAQSTADDAKVREDIEIEAALRRAREELARDGFK